MELASLLVGAGGLLASVAGVVFAILARNAAVSAKSAARAASNSVSQTLCLVGAQRALSVISRLRTLHRDQSWDAALELYRELRGLLNDISGMIPREFGDSKAELDRGFGQLRMIQALVEESVANNQGPVGLQSLSESLTSIETTLETLVSGMMPSSDKEDDTDG